MADNSIVSFLGKVGGDDPQIKVYTGITSVISSQFDSPEASPGGLVLIGVDLISLGRNDRKIYVHREITSDIKTSFSTPSTIPEGVAIDISGNLISSDAGQDKIYIHDKITSTTTSNFSSPDIYPTGLVVDDSDNLISCDTESRKIYVHDGITSTVNRNFSSPGDAVSGLALDSSGNLISVDANNLFVHDGVTSTITSQLDIITSGSGPHRGVTIQTPAVVTTPEIGISSQTYEITAVKGGWLNFNMIVFNKSKAKLIIEIDGNTKLNVTPFRLFTLGATAPNSYVWVGKYDETNNEYGIEMGRKFPFSRIIKIIIEAPTGEIVNIIYSNIFWEDENHLEHMWTPK